MNLEYLLQLPEGFIDQTKVHLAIGQKIKKKPLYIYYKGEFKEYQEYQTKKNFSKKYILSLAYYGKDEWLFTGIYESLSVKDYKGENFHHYHYETKLLDYGKEFIGRLILNFKKEFRASYPYLETIHDKLSLSEILREPYTIDDFPGYENVKVDNSLLKSIIKQEEKSWKTALSIVKGVYLITDTKTGKLYVGSAYGQDAFWNRWSEYAKTIHGGNKGLRKLIKEEGEEYAQYLQYSILETRSMNAEDDEIILRESFWKEVLVSREFGYNEN